MTPPKLTDPTAAAKLAAILAPALKRAAERRRPERAAA